MIFAVNMGLEGIHGVLLDTSFVIRLMKTGDPLHANAQSWFKELLDRQIPMYLSTIVIAEYCVKGSFDELPVRNLRVLPFNVDHARRAGPFAGTLLEQRIKGGPDERTVVLNDVKLLAQAESAREISHFLTKDAGFHGRVQQLRDGGHVLGTRIIDLETPLADILGRLDFPG